MNTLSFPLSVRVCAYHEPRQESLPGFVFTHGICPVCMAFQYSTLKCHECKQTPKTCSRHHDDCAMSKHHVEWVSLIRDGGWRERASGSYFPELHRNVSTKSSPHEHQVVIHQELTWTLYRDTIFCDSGDLSEMLHLAESFVSASSAH